jgi:alkyl hydroperoxide reductase subunit AhpC
MMSIRLGQICPDFEQDTTNGSLRLHAWLGGFWGLLFSYARDFTPIPALELAEVARLHPDWVSRSIKPIGLSIDDADRHRDFERAVARDTCQRDTAQRLNFPLIADSDRFVATLYGMVYPELHPDITASCVFVIDPAKRVRLVQAGDPAVVRNFRDILRAIDELQAAVVVTNMERQSVLAEVAP